jgi:benzodiazapine receptor
MIVLTVALIVLAWPIRRLAALLLLPYLAWLCFAALLTAEIMARNPDAVGLVPQPASADIVL